MNFTELKTYVETATGELYDSNTVLLFLNEALSRLGEIKNATFPKVSLSDISSELPLSNRWHYMIGSFIIYRLLKADSRYREALDYQEEWENEKSEFLRQYVVPDIYKNSTTKTTITTNVTKGSSVVTVTDTTGFAINDKVILTDNTNSETLIIQAITGNDITFSSALMHDYSTGSTLYHPIIETESWDFSEEALFPWWRIN